MTKAEREKQHQREVAVSRLKLVLIIVCLIAIPLTFWLNHRDVGSVSNRVTKVESPCLKYSEEKTKENKRLCEESFEKAVLTITHAQACAILRKAGLEIVECAHARLRQERTRHQERMRSGGGGAPQQPSSTAPQPPSPQDGGSGNSGGVGEGAPPAPGNGGSTDGSTDSPSQPNGPSVPNQFPPPAPAPEPEANGGGLSLDPVVQGAGEVVGDVFEGVDKALCPVLQSCP